MEAKLELEKIQRNNVVIIRVIVRGNVGVEGRTILNDLGMTPVVDIANCREKFVSNAIDLDALRNALVERGVVSRG